MTMPSDATWGSGGVVAELLDEFLEGGAAFGGGDVADEHCGAPARGLRCARHRGDGFGILTDDDREWERVGAHSPGCIFE